MSTRIATYRTIRELGASRWDALAHACSAPVFYEAAFLSAFEQYPLHDIGARFYLVGEDERGALTFGLPLYLLHGVDPMQVIRTHFADAAGSSILLTHVWHCYDTWLLARGLDADGVRSALTAVARLAADLGAAFWGFANVDAAGPLGGALDAHGLTGLAVDERYARDLSSIDGLRPYLATLHRSARSNMTRYRQLADRAGVATTLLDADVADLDGFVTLARQNAEKYHNADYYRPGLFQDFVRALGAHARVIEHRLDGRLIGSAILLVDDTRLHFWVSGNDYDAVPQVSPFYLCFLSAMGEALATGKTSFEAGRRNTTFKTRYGMNARPLRAYIVRTTTGPKGDGG